MANFLDPIHAIFSPDEQSWVEVASCNETTCDIRDLLPNTEYYYRVAAKNKVFEINLLFETI